MLQQTVTIFLLIISVNSCKIKKFEKNNTVCECSSTYCDFYPDPLPPESGTFIEYITTKAGVRMFRQDGNISNKSENHILIKIDSNKHYQRMEGFGGAFTDSACINIKKLKKNTQINLMKSYFSTNGSNYNLGRVPIAGTDFSVRPYTYDDFDNDTELKHFQLATEDFEYKMPLMNQALRLNPSLRFLSAAWTAPPWMKSNNRYNGIGWLRSEYYETYADYIIKFLEEYKKYKFDIWMVSTGNEPLTALNPFSRINSMFWSPFSTSKWVKENLAPRLQKSISNNTHILMVDDERPVLLLYAGYFALQKDTLKYFEGLAVHGYLDDFVPAFLLDLTHKFLPDKFILCTEFSISGRPLVFQKVILGSWDRAENIIKHLFKNINHWVVGWVDWNLALDMKGGPNWVGNYADAMIIVDEKKDVFYKQPMYYAMTHFSKFVPRNAVRIDVSNTDKSILTTAFKAPSNQIIVILYNTNNRKKNVSISDGRVGNINIELPEKSLHTILYTSE